MRKGKNKFLPVTEGFRIQFLCAYIGIHLNTQSLYKTANINYLCNLANGQTFSPRQTTKNPVHTLLVRHDSGFFSSCRVTRAVTSGPVTSTASAKLAVTRSREILLSVPFSGVPCNIVFRFIQYLMPSPLIHSPSRGPFTFCSNRRHDWQVAINQL